MNTTYPEEDMILEVLTSPEESDSRLVIDMTDLTEIEGEVIRVELRRVRDPVTGPVKPSKKIVEKSYLVGLIGPDDLPVEGENFGMAYHTFNSMSDFGSIDSGAPVTNLVIEEKCYYFNTPEGQWRLKILDSGN